MDDRRRQRHHSVHGRSNCPRVLREPDFIVEKIRLILDKRLNDVVAVSIHS